MKPVVLILCRRTVVSEDAVAIARAVEADGRATATIAVDRGLVDRVAGMAPVGTRLVSLSGEPVVPRPAAPAARPTLPERLRQSILRSGPLRTMAMVRAVRADMRRAAALLDRIAPLAIVIFDDRARSDMTLIRVAQTRGIRVALAPYALSSPESDIALRLKSGVDHRLRGRGRLIKQFVVSRHPAQARMFGGEPYTFFPASEYPALALHGLLDGKPWIWGGGGADVVCALDSGQRKRLVAEGIAPDRIRVTGQAALDRLFATMADRATVRAGVVTRYGLDPAAPVVICAVPQSAEHNQLDWASHRSATIALFDALNAAGAGVLLSLHPRSDRRYYAELAGAYPALHIADQPLAAVLSAADLFVATFSSTVRWAQMAGIPSVVIDPAALAYDLFDGEGGIVVLKDQADWRGTIGALCRDEAARLALCASLPAFEGGRGHAGRSIVEAALGDPPQARLAPAPSR